MLYLTSSDVSSRPFTGGTLWNVTPCRRRKEYVTSSFCSQLSARSGRILVPSWLNFRSALYVWWSTWRAASPVSRGGGPGFEMRVDAAEGPAPHHEGAASLGVPLGPRDPCPSRGQARHAQGTR